MKTNLLFVMQKMTTGLLYILFFFTLGCVSVAKSKEEQKYEVFENHDISACGINDPLLKIEWLKEYCVNLLQTQYFSSVYIYLYKVIDTGEHLFKISISFSDFEYSPFLYSEDWRDCAGNLIFGINSGVPSKPGLVEEFLNNKEYVTELLQYVKQ